MSSEKGKCGGAVHKFCHGDLWWCTDDS